MARLPVRPLDIAAPGPEHTAALHRAQDVLSKGHDCLIHLNADTVHPVAPGDLAQASARFMRAVMRGAPVGGLIVAGGDRSGAIVDLPAPDWLDHAGDICAGVPILRACQVGMEISLALKGGQMGGAGFFADARAAMRRP